MIMEHKAIQTNSYLDKSEIEQHLANVEYIIMTAPAPEKFAQTPLHFTFFLNTPSLPHEVIEPVLDKFLEENEITNPIEILAQPMPVGFGQSVQQTPMPMLLIKPEDVKSIPHTTMFVYDFLADSNNFDEAKRDSLTGWSYSYND